MKIASTLLNWLTQAATQPELNPTTAAPAAAKSQIAANPSPTGPQDKVQFSELAQKLSQASTTEGAAQITLEERLALRQDVEPQTYKPSLMQMAMKFLRSGLS
ncbi:hypothetical protein [Geoalkalibacter sp.]|uniref:hypothetical protein n=1 Tax=Geoalkalibacter sp. TaxID=3041440 RepID=UPI00272DF68B|nr:hypothetical protein [Geoalkalibacter sp.]